MLNAKKQISQGKAPGDPEILKRFDIDDKVSARGGGKRRGLGPRNDVLTTCKAVTPRGGQRKIAVLFPQ